MSSLLEQTIRPLWLGGTKATANALYGSTGALLKGIGDYAGNETISSWGNSLLDFNAGVQEGIRNNWVDNLGDTNSSYPQIMGVLGEAVPAFALSTFAPNALTSVLAQSLFESGEAAGEFANDMHSENRYDEEAQQTTMKNFLTNLAINTAINASPSGEQLLSKYNKLKKWKAWQKAGANIGKGLLDELFLQEPLQRAVNEASNNAVDQHSAFTSPLLWEMAKYPVHLWDTFAGNDYADLPVNTKDNNSYISNIMTLIELGIDPRNMTTRNEMK